MTAKILSPVQAAELVFLRRVHGVTFCNKLYSLKFVKPWMLILFSFSSGSTWKKNHSHRLIHGIKIEKQHARFHLLKGIYMYSKVLHVCRQYFKNTFVWYNYNVPTGCPNPSKIDEPVCNYASCRADICKRQALLSVDNFRRLQHVCFHKLSLNKRFWSHSISWVVRWIILTATSLILDYE